MGRIVAVLAGQPSGDYAEELTKAHDAMKTEGSKAGLGRVSPQGAHVRGRFPAYNCGTTMGMGNPRPVVMNPKEMRPLISQLLQHEGIIRMARYQDCKLTIPVQNLPDYLLTVAFKLWAPRVYAEYVRVRDTVLL